MRFAYNQAPDLTYWWLDGYVDLNESQSPRVREALASWFAWHRANEVPLYVELLARAEREAPADQSPEQMCRWYDVVATLRRVRDGMGAAEAQVALRALLSRVRESPVAEYRAYQQRLVKANCLLASQVHDATTPEQRRGAVKRLKGWEDDLRSLVPAK